MTQLVELNGAAPQAGKYAALMKIDPRELSDLDAAIWGMKMFAVMSPEGATWREALAADPEMSGDPRLAGWWTDLKKAVGGTFSDIGDKLGDWSGSAIRLLTDQEVQNGVARGVVAYASGGQSEALRALFPGMGPENTRGSMENMGVKIKQMFGSIPMELWIGLGALVALAIGIKMFRG